MSAAAGIKRFGLLVAGIVVAGFAGLLALPLLISADSVRESVKLQIRTVTGLDPVLRGDVAVATNASARTHDRESSAKIRARTRATLPSTIGAAASNAIEAIAPAV